MIPILVLVSSEVMVGWLSLIYYLYCFVQQFILSIYNALNCWFNNYVNFYSFSLAFCAIRIENANA